MGPAINCGKNDLKTANRRKEGSGAIDVHLIRDHLEGEERNTKRQKRRRPLNRPVCAYERKHGVDVVRDEAGVFEPQQQRQIDADDECQLSARSRPALP
jgi:hypothetical protein